MKFRSKCFKLGDLIDLGSTLFSFQPLCTGNMRVEVSLGKYAGTTDKDVSIKLP
ncbi:MAG: hypothetical protein SFY32_13130 [Bacteroidota bacterium]|nr:hypothetical protein [Bacteroidota bacterium]